MLLRICAVSFLFVIVLLPAGAAEAQQTVILHWDAASDGPVGVDGYIVYQDGVRITDVLPPTQFSYGVTITAAVHVFAVTSFSHDSGESEREAASFAYYSDLWLPPPPSESSSVELVHSPECSKSARVLVFSHALNQEDRYAISTRLPPMRQLVDRVA